MSMGKWFLCAALVLSGASILTAADEPAPATQPTDAKPPRPKKLTEPWSFLKTLTPEQTTQIEQIHSDAADQIKKIMAKENDDIMALLTPDQVTELKEAEAKHKLEEKERAAARRKKDAATQPAN